MTVYRRIRVWLQLGFAGLSVAGFALAVVSLGLNVFVLARADRSPGRPSSSSALAAVPPAGITRWSQLAPDDPEAFARNLRALGCPEPTISALAGTAPAAPAPQSAGDAGQQAGSAAPPQSNPSPTAVAQQIFVPSTPTRQFQMLAPAGSAAAGGTVAPPIASAPQTIARPPVAFAPALVSPSPQRTGSTGPAGPSVDAPAPAAAAAPAGTALAATTLSPAPQPQSAAAAPPAAQAPAAGGGASDSPITAPAGNSQIPVAFEDLNPALKFNAQQQAQLKKIQDQFVQDIGGPGQDPSSSAYLKSWQTAQWLSDQRFRAEFGYQAFLYQQMQQNMHSIASTATP